MFTLLSERLAGVPSDSARIAAQIIPGIGFIGAGSILHTGRLTSGLNTAATIFVVASIGMATGGGLYVTAMFATALVLLVLLFLGHAEQNFNLKVLITSYEVTGPTVEVIRNEVNHILEGHHRLMQNILTGDTGKHIRLQFDVEGCDREQREMFHNLRASSILESVTCLGRVERE